MICDFRGWLFSLLLTKLKVFCCIFLGAYYFSESAKIIGIEMNPDLCRLQKQVAEQFSLSDRISIVEAEMTSRPGEKLILQWTPFNVTTYIKSHLLKDSK
jgi:hypothetical protein